MISSREILSTGILWAALVSGCQIGPSRNLSDLVAGRSAGKLARIGRAVGSNPIKCLDNGIDNVLPPSKVFILHIPATIFADLAANMVNCGAANSCVSSALPNGTSASESAAALQGSGMNWPTPLDIDLDPAPGPGTTNWQPGKSLLIKIVLDDPSDMFFFPPSNRSDASHALLQGDEGNGMFRCASNPLQEVEQISKKPPRFAVRWFITVKVFNSSIDYLQDTKYDYGYKSMFGGLNIGILRPLKSGEFMPIYLDPMIHNKG